MKRENDIASPEETTNGGPTKTPATIPAAPQEHPQDADPEVTADAMKIPDAPSRTVSIRELERVVREAYVRGRNEAIEEYMAKRKATGETPVECYNPFARTARRSVWNDLDGR